MPATVCIRNETERARALHWCRIAPPETVVQFKKPGRSIPQNDRMWAMLTRVSQQAHHNGNRYSPDQWKQLFMHACGHESHFMAGLNGEPFPAGFRSSKMTVEQMTELHDFIEEWASQNGVNLGEA